MKFIDGALELGIEIGHSPHGECGLKSALSYALTSRW